MIVDCTLYTTRYRKSSKQLPQCGSSKGELLKKDSLGECTRNCIRESPRTPCIVNTGNGVRHKVCAGYYLQLLQTVSVEREPLHQRINLPLDDCKFFVIADVGDGIGNEAGHLVHLGLFQAV